MGNRSFGGKPRCVDLGAMVDDVLDVAEVQAGGDTMELDVGPPVARVPVVRIAAEAPRCIRGVAQQLVGLGTVLPQRRRRRRCGG